MNSNQNNQITPFNYQGAKIIDIAKTSKISDSYQIRSESCGWMDAAYGADYLVSIGADREELNRIQCN